jgi:hypothetical protein
MTTDKDVAKHGEMFRDADGRLADTKPDVAREAREHIIREVQKLAFKQFAWAYNVKNTPKLEQVVHRIMMEQKEEKQADRDRPYWDSQPRPRV